jgi:general nucleoside transport system permease protein
LSSNAESLASPVSPPAVPAVRLRRILRGLVVPALALFSGLVAGAIVIALSNPDFWTYLRSDPARSLGSGVHLALQAYSALWQSSLGGPRDWSETLVQATPLMFVGLAVALSFRAGFFNVGAQGQFILGTIFAVPVGASFASLPAVIHIPLTLLAGFVGGALWGIIPGFLKARMGANEVITTLMLNFVALNLIAYVLTTPLWQRPGRFDPISKLMAPSAQLPHLSGYRVHIGIILALLAAYGVWWLLFRSTFGFELRAVGTNASAAAYAGMSVGRTYLLVTAIAGGLAGIAGTVNLLGVLFTSTSTDSGTYGFDAITVALLGRMSPVGVVLAALLLGGLRAGSIGMQAATSVDSDVVLIIQAIIIAFMMSPFLVREIYRIRASSNEPIETFSKGWSA